MRGSSSEASPLAVHSLCYKAEGGDGGHEQDQVVELGRIVSGFPAQLLLAVSRTALREYALSSASVRASTKKRRRFGRLEGWAGSGLFL